MFSITFESLEKLPAAVMIADDESKYVFVNKAAENLLGEKRENIIGKKVSDFVAPYRSETTDELWNHFRDDGTQTGHFVISRADGTDKLIKYSAIANYLPGLHLSIALEDSNAVA